MGSKDIEGILTGLILVGTAGAVLFLWTSSKNTIRPPVQQQPVYTPPATTTPSSLTTQQAPIPPNCVKGLDNFYVSVLGKDNRFHDYPFILDSGANIDVIDTATANSLGFTNKDYIGTGSVSGATGSANAGIINLTVKVLTTSPLGIKASVVNTPGNVISVKSLQKRFEVFLRPASTALYPLGRGGIIWHLQRCK